jgi:hypothetical protein
MSNQYKISTLPPTLPGGGGVHPTIGPYTGSLSTNDTSSSQYNISTLPPTTAGGGGVLQTLPPYNGSLYTNDTHWQQQGDSYQCCPDYAWILVAFGGVGLVVLLSCAWMMRRFCFAERFDYDKPGVSTTQFDGRATMPPQGPSTTLRRMFSLN